MIDRQQEGTGTLSGNKRRLIYFFTALLSLFFVVSSVAETGSHHSKDRKHFLWSVEGKRSTVYVVGSIHLLKKDSYPLPAAIEKIFDCCNKIVFETDLDGMKRPEVQNMMMKLGMYPAGGTLSKNISQDTYALLREKLNVSGIPVDRFEQFKPWFISINLASMELKRMGFDPALGIDRHFFERAKQEKKEMMYLETNAFQINLFGRLSRQKQQLLLKQTLQELNIIETEFREMIAAWRTGDSELFHSIINKSFKEYPYLYNRLIIRRNREWIPEIIKLMNRPGDALIIVGSGHLVGKDSVLDFLKKKGYLVNQL